MDMWENGESVNLFSVCAFHAGLIAARNFAICFGQQELSEKYSNSAENIKSIIEQYFFSKDDDRFVRAISFDENGDVIHDKVLDSSALSLVKFSVFESGDPRVLSTVTSISDSLWVKTPSGGLARFEGDSENDTTPGIPGSPWFVSTLLLAEFLITKAESIEELKCVLPFFEWAITNAGATGLLPEKIDPEGKSTNCNKPHLWSHAEFVIAVINYLEKLEKLKVCESCGQSVYRMRRHWPMQVKLHDVLEKYSEQSNGQKELNGLVIFEYEGEEATLAIDLRECIGCGVCTTNCQKEILKMVEDKAQVDMDKIHSCNLCMDCQTSCPVNAIKIGIKR